LGPKALERCPGLSEGTIDGQVLVRKEPRRLRLTANGPEEGPSNIGGEEPLTILGKGRWIPYRIIHRKTDKPAEQEIVLELFDSDT
jgi:hypothetical protein